jgi:hypothetical protein
MAATYSLESALIVAAIEAMRGAAAIAAGYREEGHRQAELDGQHQAEGDARRQASLSARMAMANDIDREAARWRHLLATRQSLAQQLGMTLPEPAPPLAAGADADPRSLAALLAAWRQANAAQGDSLAALAEQCQSLSANEIAALTNSAPDLAEQLAVFEVQARLSAVLPATLLAERKALIQRILARLGATEQTTLAAGIDQLVSELLRTPSPKRAEALASELRRQVERRNQVAAAEAAAIVLEQSLRDLGYDVDGIGETLFVEGGVAHFQKPGWNDYFVRLRIDAVRGAVNFNVVRPGAAGDDRRQEDLLAEERWCAEFPQLQQTLAKRGLQVAVTRMLAAGEVPVQVVDVATLPHATQQDERQASVTPRAMHRP